MAKNRHGHPPVRADSLEVKNYDEVSSNVLQLIRLQGIIKVRGVPVDGC